MPHDTLCCRTIASCGNNITSTQYPITLFLISTHYHLWFEILIKFFNHYLKSNDKIVIILDWVIVNEI